MCEISNVCFGLKKGVVYLIKILIVEDSPLVCKILNKVFESDPELRVVGVASTGKEAVKLAMDLKPDIITMDIVMPDMDGVEATKQIMAYQPTPILLLTSSHLRKQEAVFRAISFGALDVAEKTSFEQSLVEDDVQERILSKIKLLSRIKVIRHPLARLEKERPVVKIQESEGLEASVVQGIVAIAASTGGPQALAAVLSKFPINLPYAVLVVQHIAKGFSEGLVEWLSNACVIKIKLAENNEIIKPAIVYIAPNDTHMKIGEGGRIRLTDEPPDGSFKPSANALFYSAASAYKRKTIGVILTGMGRDGVLGIKAIKDSGGCTIAQDEKSCIIFGMPKEAIALGVIDKVLSIEKIADEVMAKLS